MKQTKIVATLGPASSEFSVIKKLIEAGANVFRLNFSHGSAEQHIQLAENVRKAAKECGTRVGVLADLQGPKIRIACFKASKISLEKGQTFILDAELDNDEGTETSVGLDYPALVNDVTPGNILLLDDGRIQLKATSVDNQKIITEVLVGGTLSNRKGINLLGGGLSAPALTEKDKKDIITVARMNADYVAVSFPRDAQDLHYARKLIREAGSQAKIVAKVERAEVVASEAAMDAMILASDIIMVARGDLGVEIGDARLPGVQKALIERCRYIGRPVITATQMMESMITNPMPTRAEVLDVANAVLDGTDAVMLSAESAAGEYPVEAVEAMARVAEGSEKDHINDDLMWPTAKPMLNFSSEKRLAIAAMMSTVQPGADTALVVHTHTGDAVHLLSRMAGATPIIAVSDNNQVLNQLTVKRGVLPVYMETAGNKIDADSLNRLFAQLKPAERHSNALVVHLPSMEGEEGEDSCRLVNCTQSTPEFALA